MGYRLGPFLVALTVVLLGFQNCSDVGFSSEQEPGGVVSGAGRNGPDEFPGQNGINGLNGGHFDLDTSTKIYPTGQGTTNHHVHEYDKAHQTTNIDFFNLIDSGFDNIQAAISPGQRFVLNVVNANLSKGGTLDINGANVTVGGFRSGQIYTIGPASISGDISLRVFRLGFAPDILSKGGLAPTATKCVRANDAGSLGEYRNGALTVQALAVGNFSLDPATGAATSGLLWEATVFWHWDGGCN